MAPLFCVLIELRGMELARTLSHNRDAHLLACEQEHLELGLARERAPQPFANLIPTQLSFLDPLA